NTRPDDTVLVGGSHTEALFLAGRRPPTRYVYQYAALATRGYATPARVDELRADLQRARPPLIPDAATESFVPPPLDRAARRARDSARGRASGRGRGDSGWRRARSRHRRAGCTVASDRMARPGSRSSRAPSRVARSAPSTSSCTPE